MADEKAKVTKKITGKVVSKTAETKVAPVKKVAAKPAEKKEVKAEVSVEKVSKKETAQATVSVNVVGVDGKVTGKIALPGEIFGEKVNEPLLAQAVRVYLANQRQGNASTKTRGEVEGSTRKIYRQKGTGRARHGSVRAPIFVKGGIVFGPKPRDFGLSLPQKMKQKALFSALSSKVRDNEMIVLDGLIGLKPKTKVFVEMLKHIGVAEKKQKLLFVTAANTAQVMQSGRNIPGVNFIPATLVNTYEVLGAKKLIVMKEAVDEMKKHFLKKSLQVKSALHLTERHCEEELI